MKIRIYHNPTKGIEKSKKLRRGDRIIKGGGYSWFKASARVRYRFIDDPSGSNNNALGFRIAKKGK